MGDLRNLHVEYIGRGIIVGKTEENISFATYILTGRSDPSKARTLEYDSREGVVYTKPTNMKDLEKGSPVLLLYPAIIKDDDRIVISNGAQTNLLFNDLMRNENESRSIFVLHNALKKDFYWYDPKLGMINVTSFEPDSPNYTPRINGCIIKDDMSLSIIRKDNNEADKKYFDFSSSPMNPGEGRLIMTYDGDDTGKEPLHPFTGEPLDLCLEGRTQEEITEEIRGNVNPNTLISIATQFIENDEPHIFNIHGGKK